MFKPQLKGAWIAFLKLYGYKALGPGVKAEPRLFYPPTKGWIDNKLKDKTEEK